jgi:hypothetical protein
LPEVNLLTAADVDHLAGRRKLRSLRLLRSSLNRDSRHEHKADNEQHAHRGAKELSHDANRGLRSRSRMPPESPFG